MITIKPFQTFYQVIIRENDGDFHSFLSVKGKNFWKTKAIAVKHGKEFVKMFPQYTIEVESFER